MVIKPIVGVYIPIITVPIKGEMTIPNIGSLDPGTYINSLASMKTYHMELRMPGLTRVCEDFCACYEDRMKQINCLMFNMD